VTPEERRHRKRAYRWRVRHRENILATTKRRTFRLRFKGPKCGRCQLLLEFDSLVMETVDGRYFHHATVYGGCFIKWFDDWLLARSLEETTEGRQLPLEDL